MRFYRFFCGVTIVFLVGVLLTIASVSKAQKIDEYTIEVNPKKHQVLRQDFSDRGVLKDIYDTVKENNRLLREINEKLDQLPSN